MSFEDQKAVRAWLADRLREPSTWAGIGAMCALLHHQLPPGMTDNLAAVGCFVSSLLAVGRGER